MRKCRLIGKKHSCNGYKGEPYMRATLSFEIIYLGFFKKIKIITYDVTMFENYKSYLDNWDEMIENKRNVKYSIIQDRIIF